MNTSKKKFKKAGIIIAVIISVLLIAAVIFFQFTSLGYRMTVPYRNFTQIQKNVYIDNSYGGDRDQVTETVNAAKERVSDFWGNIESSPVIIITDNEKTIKKLGGDHNTSTAVLFRAFSYIAVSDKYLNVDILAHELTHAELHARLYKGKLPQTLIPIWFDEGVAIQNDYREQYSDEVWAQATNNGSDVISLDDMDTASEFYAGSAEDRRLRYVISRHEVKKWIEEYGVNELFDLIDRVNSGEDFYELYDHTK